MSMTIYEKMKASGLSSDKIRRDILRSPIARNWLKEAIDRALVMDPVDCLKSAETLEAWSRLRCDECLSSKP